MSFLKKILKGRVSNITTAAILIASFSLLSRFLGIFRDHILASLFGAGQELDIYYAAFRVPDFVYNLVVLGALSAGFIPIFSQKIKELKERDKVLLKKEAQAGKLERKKSKSKAKIAHKELIYLANNIFNTLLILLIFISILGVIFAGPITKKLVPGFSLAAQAEVKILTQIMFLSPIFLGMSGILGGILQSYKRFFAFSLSPVFYNLGIIFGALVLVRFFGSIGLALGVVLGAFLHLAIQIPSVWRLGFRYKAVLNWKDKALRQTARMMGPRTLSLAVAQINLIAITIFASMLDSGSLSIFNLANNLQSFPLGIFGISFAVAAFPFLSEHAFNIKELSKRFSFTMRQILFFIIPSTVLLITLRAQIIRVVLGSGSFNWDNTILTMNTLAFFSLSLFAQASIPLLIRVFYARQDSKTPFYLSLMSVGFNIFLAYYLSSSLGVIGLALAFSIANILNFFLLWLFLFIKVGNLDMERIIISTLKFTGSAICAGVVIQLSKNLIWPFIDMSTFIGVATQLVVSALAGIVAYLLVAYILKSEELLSLISTLSKKIRLKKANLSEQDELRGI